MLTGVRVPVQGPPATDPAAGHALPPLRGREPELELIGQWADRVLGSRQALLGLLAGGPGSGRSRLLREAELLTGGRGFQVARVRRGPLDTLEGALSAALGVGRPAPEESALRRAHALLAEQLRTMPVLISCDHPLPVPALRQLLAPYRESPLLLLAVEPAGEPAPSLRPAPAERTQRLPLTPLAPAAARQMAADLLGAPPDPELAELLGMAQGRPRLLAELLDSLDADRVLHLDEGLARLTERGRPPRALHGLANRRIAAASPPARELLEAAAVLGRSSLPEDVAQILHRPVAALAPAVRDATGTGLLDGSSDELTFRHELLRQSVLAELPRAVRSALHRQALGIQLARGHSITAAAPHLLHGAHPDAPATATLLRVAATESLADNPGTAAELALRGVAVVTDPGAATPMLALAAEACLRSGALTKSISLALGALEGTSDGRTAEAGQTPDSSEAAQAAQASPAVPARLRTSLATALLLRGDYPAALTALAAVPSAPGVPAAVRRDALLTRIAALAAEAGPDAGERIAEVRRLASGQGLDLGAAAVLAEAVLHWRDGRAARALELAAEAAALRAQGSLASWHHSPELSHALLLAQLGLVTRARAALAAAPLAPEFTGPLLRHLAGARLALAEGRPAAAGAEAAGALGQAEAAGLLWAERQARSVLAALAVQHGEFAIAQEHAQVLRRAEPESPAALLGHWVEAQLAAAEHDPERLRHALALVWPSPPPPGGRALLVREPPFAPWLVRALLTTGQRARATAFGAVVRALAVANPGLPAIHAAASHVRGLLDHDAVALEAAARAHRDAWARTSALEDLGILLAGTDRDRAVRTLEEALEAYQRLGADRDAARARRRLRSLGMRHRHQSRPDRPRERRPSTGWPSLTTTERTVAEYAAQGMTNRQIAGRMFLSPHTVAFHLRQIFRKLAIHSRLELALKAREK
ncbi:helix-turn-helix transcriptional regulator [Kitasatospora viridis]|uniref:Regulatory LuxR family protein n=1 Tax=Kitasatospora viridis TaxID=281105 RepID=A0A561SF22_9ACTN|nr:helix-turn-helix transcriptional regulator [Kitasatospora viridis]TWF73407.1 regulatory LuxR family protein [Kitasatospora viridis]